MWNQTLAILDEQKNYTALQNMAEKALDYFPNQAVVHYYSGIANAQLNQPLEAIAAYKTGLNLTNKNLALQGDLLKNLLPLYLKNQKLNEAKSLLSKYLSNEAAYDYAVL